MRPGSIAMELTHEFRGYRTELAASGNCHGNINQEFDDLRWIRSCRRARFYVLIGTSDTPVEVNLPVAAIRGFLHRPTESCEDLQRFPGCIDERPERSQAATACLDILTPRQHQIMDLVLAGERSKNIAMDLGISRRTVENHRAAIMKKTGSKSIPALARLAFMSAMNGFGQPSIETGRSFA